MSRVRVQCPSCRRKLDASPLIHQFRLMEEGVRFRDLVGGCELTIPWFHVAHVIVFVGYIVAIYFAYQLTAAALEGWRIWAAVAVTVFVAYGLFARLVNRTRIVMSGSELTVTHGPLRWGRRITIPLTSLARFECQKMGGGGGDGSRIGGRSARFYFLAATMHDGQSVVLTLARASQDQVRLSAETLNGRLQRVSKP